MSETRKRLQNLRIVRSGEGYFQGFVMETTPVMTTNRRDAQPLTYEQAKAVRAKLVRLGYGATIENFIRR